MPLVDAQVDVPAENNVGVERAERIRRLLAAQQTQNALESTSQSNVGATAAGPLGATPPAAAAQVAPTTTGQSKDMLAMPQGWQTMGTGVRVGPEMSGREVLARGDLTPDSRSFFTRAEAGREADRQNPIIQALGGTQAPYGESGGIPTIGQASSRLGRDLSPIEYAELMRVGSQTGAALSGTAIQRGQLGINQQMADQSNPLHTNQAAADARGAAMLAQSIARIRTEKPHLTPEQIYREAAGENGMSIERAQQLLGANAMSPRPITQLAAPVAGPMSAGGAVPASVQGWTPVSAEDAGLPAPPRMGGALAQPSPLPVGAAPSTPPPALVPPVNNFAQTPTSGGAAKPWQNIEQQLNAALGQVNVGAGQPMPTGVDSRGIPKNADIGEFINRLETQQPGLLASRWPDIQRYLSDRFGDDAVESALRASSNNRQIDPGATLIGRALNPMPWLQGARQLMTGPNNSERGLAVLGSLLRAVQRFGGHENFLRQQRSPLAQ